MKAYFRPLLATIAALGVISGSAVADNYYFRLRPSIQILNQERLTLSVDGDRKGVTGSRFTAKARADGGRDDVKYSLTAGSLPPGVDLDTENGAISGTPLAKGAFSATLMASDGANSATALFNVAVFDPIEISQMVPTLATVGVPYSATFNANGGDGDNTWMISGTLPPGLAFSHSSPTAASLSGTPTQAGSYSGMRVRVADNSGYDATTNPFTVTVAEPLTISGAPSAYGTVGVSYSTTFNVAGGHLPYNWFIDGGALPSGLSLSGGGISGTPSAAATANNLVVRVVDAAGNTATTSPFNLSVAGAVAISGSPSDRATVGSPYSASLSATGGDGTYTWTIETGSLPSGITLSNGAITGIPTVAGQETGISVRVTDGVGRSAVSATFSINVADALTVSSPTVPHATVGESFALTFDAKGGFKPYNWTIEGGALPAGLSLANGIVSGIPASQGDHANLSVRVTDAAGNASATPPFSINVDDRIALSGTPSATGVVGQLYSAKFVTTGGRPPYTWSLGGGALPNGLSLTNDTISGTPIAPGAASNLVVSVTDAAGRTAQSAAFGINITNPMVVSGSTPSGSVGQYYSATLSATGGAGGYVWSIASGTLPPGLSLIGGTISGTPQTAGTWSNIVVRVTDALGNVANSSPLAISVTNPIVISGSPSSGTVGSYYYAPLSVSGGTGTGYSWQVYNGSFPTGLQLSPIGEIYGYPTSSGNFTFNIRVFDSANNVNLRSFTISVANPLAPVTVSGSAPATGKVGTAYSATFTASGGHNSFTWSIYSGSLPTGLSMSNGRITGTPSVAGTWSNIRLMARDSSGDYALSSVFSITVSSPLSISGTFPSGTVGTSYSYQFTASGGRTPYNWIVSSGSLPVGLGHSAGRISGTPSVAGTASGIVIRVTDADGQTAYTPSLSLTINGPPVTPGTWTFDITSGEFGSWTVPNYNTLVVEVFGAGGGGMGGTAAGDPGGGGLADVPRYGKIIAYGGQGALFPVGSPVAYGGTATGGDINLTGQNGNARLQSSSSSAVAVFGGASGGVSYGGGGATAQTALPPAPVGNNLDGVAYGAHGNGPGGGGAGCRTRMRDSYVYYGSGAGGGYARKTFSNGQSNAPLPGQVIPYQVARQGLKGRFPGVACSGDGAHGRIRFTVN